MGPGIMALFELGPGPKTLFKLQDGLGPGPRPLFEPGTWDLGYLEEGLSDTRTRILGVRV